MTYKVIDLFAGAGGLSSGFMQTAKFEIVLAVENNKKAQKTYRRNHIGTEVLDDVRSVKYNEIVSKFGNIDAIIGGPPCQGFSNANRQKNHLVNSNNQLVKEYIRAILTVQPKLFVMENVSMLNSDTHKFYYSTLDKEHIDDLDISLNQEILEIELPQLHAQKIYQDVTSGYKFDHLSLPEKIYKPFNILFKLLNSQEKYQNTLNKKKSEVIKVIDLCLEFYSENKEDYYTRLLYNNSQRLKESFISSDIEFKEDLKLFVLFQRTFIKLCELSSHQIIIDAYKIEDNILQILVQSYTVIDYIKKALNGDYKTVEDILNAAEYGVPQNRERFIMIGIKSDSKFIDKLELPKASIGANNFFTVKDAIYDLEKYIPEQELNETGIQRSNKERRNSALSKYLCDSDKIYNHINTKSTDVAVERFRHLKEGQNFHDLSSDLKSTYSSPEKTQNSIYLRLDYEKPSGTVLNVRKSMWVHPKIDRALSIREAARLQTFPDSFVFEGTKDSQYQQIGNAVPPLLGRAIAEKILESGKVCSLAASLILKALSIFGCTHIDFRT
ncbi:MAG: DNA cytosine methyltransferase, partial [Dethiosulfatibacter sp.]|nr:DNA cytosine methyltransferase [Dethiosulfatibacter sp.]